MDLEDIEYVQAGLRFRGAQGTTGTQVISESVECTSWLELDVGFVRGNLSRRHLEDR